jgi:hypothetical protein
MRRVNEGEQDSQNRCEQDSQTRFVCHYWSMLGGLAYLCNQFFR